MLCKNFVINIFKNRGYTCLDRTKIKNSGHTDRLVSLEFSKGDLTFSVVASTWSYCHLYPLNTNDNIYSAKDYEVAIIPKNPSILKNDPNYKNGWCIYATVKPTDFKALIDKYENYVKLGSKSPLVNP